MYYKFQLTFPRSCKKLKSQESYILGNENINCSDNFAENWECLVDETNNNNWCKKKQSHSTPGDLDGVFILVVYSSRFGPFPTDMICSHDTNSLRCAGGRELLSTNMISKILELDFVSTTKAQTVTVRYLKVYKYKVIPWWHPDFKKTY